MTKHITSINLEGSILRQLLNESKLKGVTLSKIIEEKVTDYKNATLKPLQVLDSDFKAVEIELLKYPTLSNVREQEAIQRFVRVLRTRLQKKGVRNGKGEVKTSPT